MSGHTIEAVLTWMRDYPDLSGWDMIHAVDTRALNESLQQAHLLRWRNGNGIDEIDGSFDIEHTDVSHVLSGMRLAGPVLDLPVSEELAVVRVALQVEGSHVVLRNRRTVTRVARPDVLNPLKLTFELPLSGGADRLLLDLQAGDDFLLEGSGTVIEQALGGKFFCERLAELSDEQRFYVLAGMADKPGLPLRAGKDFVARLQRSADQKRMALVLWTTLQYGGNGLLPGIKLPFLLPDELEHPQQTTSLLSLKMLQRVAFVEAMLALIPDGQFTFAVDDTGKLERLSATAGQLRIPATTFLTPTVELQFDGFDLAADTLKVSFPDQAAEQSWSRAFTAPLKYRARTGDTTWTNTTLAGTVRLLHQFLLEPASDSTFITQGQLRAPITAQPEIELASGEAAGVSEAELKQSVAYVINKALFNALAPHLTARIPEHLLEDFHLGESGRVVAQRMEPAVNPAVFGTLRTEGASVRIVDTALVLKARDEHTFKAESASAAIRWSVAGLPGSSGEWGTIDEASGTYKAPDRYAMGERAARILVIAEDTTTGDRSHVQVTVLVHGINVSPSIAVIQPQETLALTAAGRSGAALDWSLYTDRPQWGSIDPTAEGTACVYTAGEPASDDEEQTWVLEEIEVADGKGETRTVRVLVELHAPGLTVSLGDLQPDGSVQLRARFNGQVVSGVEWRLPPGSPGSIDEQGVYLSDPYAFEDYVLVTASKSSPDLGNLEGYLIVPLPLEQHASLLAQIAAHEDVPLDVTDHH